MTSTNDRSVLLGEGNFPEWDRYLKRKALGKEMCWKSISTKWAQPGFVDAKNPTDYERKKQDQWQVAQDSGLSFILDSVSDQNERLIDGMDANDAYEKLKATHATTTAERQYQLLQSFSNIRQAHNESLTTFTSRLQAARDLVVGSIGPKKNTIAEFLNTLTAFYALNHLEDNKSNRSLSEQITRSKDLDLNSIVGAFSREQTLRNTRAEGAKELANHVKVAQPTGAMATEGRKKEKGPTCSHCSKIHRSENCWVKFPEKMPAWMKSKLEEQKKAKESSSSTSTPRTSEKASRTAAKVEEDEESSDDDGERCSMASRSGAHTAMGRANRDWNTDSGATSSMTPHRDWIRNMIPCKIPVRTANDEVVYAQGRGDVEFQPIIDGVRAPTVVFSRVLYVPALNANLFALLRPSMKRDVVTIINNEGIRFTKDGETFMTASFTDKTSYLNGHTITREEAKTTTSIPNLTRKLWHRRLGHIGEDRFEIMFKHEMTKGLKLQGKEEPFPNLCAPCLAGKQKREPFPSSKTIVNKPLEIVVSDLHGPLPETNEGFKYWITFTDVHSRAIWVYGLKRKDQAFESFKDWKVLVEKQTNYKVKTFRDDKGGEYIGHKWNDYMAKEGINHDRTTVDAPQSNGIAERVNAKLNTNITCMLAEARLPRSFWMHAIALAVRILNATPTSAVKGMTPHEAFYGKRPNLSKLRVFGCRAWVHVQKEKRGDNIWHTRPCVYLGFEEGYKGYKCYDDNSGKIVISRDVVFNEDEFPSIEWDTDDEPFDDKRTYIPQPKSVPEPTGGVPIATNSPPTTSGPAPIAPQHPQGAWSRGPPANIPSSSSSNSSSSDEESGPPPKAKGKQRATQQHDDSDYVPPPSERPYDDWTPDDWTPSSRYGGKSGRRSSTGSSLNTSFKYKDVPKHRRSRETSPDNTSTLSPSPNPMPAPKPKKRTRGERMIRELQGDSWSYMEENNDILRLKTRSIAPSPEPNPEGSKNMDSRTTSSSSSSSTAPPLAPKRERTRPRPINPGEMETIPMSPPGGEMRLRPGLPISMAPPRPGISYPPIPALNLNPPLPSGGVRRDQPPSFNVLERDVTGPPSTTTSSHYPASTEDETSDGERTALIQAMEITCSDDNNHIHLTAEQAMDFCIEQTLKVAADDTDPRSYREAMKRDDKKKWQEAAEKEMKAHMENGTWELVKLPDDRKAIGSRWVFKIKRDAEGKIDRYKARLVAQGFSQRPGQDFHVDEIFAPTTRMSSIRAILAISALNDWEIDSVDISNAYLNGELTEDTAVYMKQPEGFQQGDNVCKLKKGLYGLKQSGRLWYQKLGDTLKELGMTRLISDPSIYVWGSDDMKVIIPVHVDDLTITAKSKERVAQVKNAIASKFKIRDLGPISFLLGIAVTRDRSKRTLHLSQRQYCLDLLERFDMSSCKAVTTPMDPGNKFLPDDQPSTLEDIAEMAEVPYLNAVGALNYLAIATRLDISYAVHKLARFNSNPGMKHWKAVKHLFRYVQGTKDLKLTYSPDPTSTSLFTTWTDADFAGETTQQKKSTNGYLVKMGTGAISWASKLQSDIAMSSTEAELYGASFAGREIKWLQSLMSELGFNIREPSPLFIDNQSTIQVLLDNVSVTRMKHVKPSEYWIRDEVVKHHNISVSYCPTTDMPADLLTKALPRQAVEDHRSRMGLRF